MRSFVVIYLTIASLFSVVLFLYGFFPMKKYGSTVANMDNLPKSLGGNRMDSEILYKPYVGRLIIMIIDALRLDFVEGSEAHLNMPYTAGLIEERKGCLLTGIANPPTVTMPRIKAMTTGTVPNFVDVALNLGSSKILEDNILLQAKKQNMKIVFYGDETWLKLFPNTFTRSEGTTSFFVSDFTEVDDNVTRHLVNELNADDWRIMILHYLGLDHIGHVEGPQSPLVRPKLQQMDRIVKKIHRRFLGWDKNATGQSLLVVCGDHGMKNSGSHGGASPEEVLVPLIMIGEACSNKNSRSLFGELVMNAVPQIDLVPTLSLLLGIPIPASNLGKMIPQILLNIPISKQLYALHYNCKQIAAHFRKNIAHSASQESYLEYKEAVKLHKTWLTSENSSENGLNERISLLYMSALNGMGTKLAESMITFDVFLMVAASGMLLQIVIILCMEMKTYSVQISTLIIACLVLLSTSAIWCSFNGASLLCNCTVISISLALLLIVLITINMYIFMASKFQNITFSEVFNLERGQIILILGTLIHSISLSSSSFIEEEHQIWYYLWLTFVILITYELLKAAYNGISAPNQWLKYQEKFRYDWVIFYWIALAFLHRLLRKWNQTGDKWTSLPDVGDWLIEQQHRIYLSSTLIIGLMAVCCCCWKITAQYSESYKKFTETALYISAAVCIYCYRGTIGNVDIPFSYPHNRGVREVRIFWSLLTLLLTKGVGEMLYEMKVQRYSSLRILGCILNSLTCCWLLLCALLHRPHNVLLLSIQVFMSECVSIIYAHRRNTWWLVTVYIWIGHVVYFYQGNSNSLANIDVAAGYVGQEGYNPFIVGALLITNTYSAPVLSYFLLITKFVFHSQGENEHRFRDKLGALYSSIVLLRLLPVAVYVVFMIFLRYHLFVWTVFSPKMLYESMHTFIIISLLLFTEFITRLIVK